MSVASNSFPSMSDPVNQWRGEDVEPPQHPRPPPSIASSRHPVNLVARRERALSEFQATQEARMAAFMAAEAKLESEMESKMKMEDIKSEMGVKQEQASVPDLESGIIHRRLEDLDHEEVSLCRVLKARSGRGNPLPSAPVVVEDIVPALARFGVKIQVNKPKPWTGEFDELKHEGWIETVSLYLVGNALELDTVLDEVLVPTPFYILRSLFSSNATHGFLPPQAWFDARNSRQLFLCVSDVFVAIRSHSVKDNAAEEALAQNWAATQGSL
ncbi:hypothetical protein JCM11641_002274 [Rhodosporidiobolus odoratus]